jgi:hypothetical protein
MIDCWIDGWIDQSEGSTHDGSINQWINQMIVD